MATPFREYPELNGADTPDIPYRVNGALRAIDQDVEGLSNRIAGVETLGGLAAGEPTDAAMTVVANNRQSRFAKSMRAILDNAFVGSIRAQVADALGESNAPALAAAAAVKTAAKYSDFVTGDDPRLPVPLDDNKGWAYPFPDSAGRVQGGFTTEGIWRTAQPIDAPVSTSDRTRVVTVGDSLFYGYPASSTNGVPDTAAANLGAMFPGVEFTNAGQSGATTDEIRFRIGALALYAEIPGGEIPATAGERVPAIVKQKFGMGYGHEGNFYGTLAGVRGSLICDAAGKNWVFSPAFNSAAPVKVTGKQRLVREDFYPNHTTLFWMGRNDVSFKATGFEGDVVKHVVASIQAAVDHLRPHDKQFGVVSIVNQAREVRGHANYALITEINAALAERFPSNFIDMRGYLVNQGIYDAGLTPTAADLKAMSEDAPPPQIMDAGSHPLPFMVPHVAKKLAAFLEEKAYI